MSGTVVMLLLGLGTLLVGTGLLGTLLGLRAKLEHFSNTAIGTVMTAYYLGYVIGTFVVPVLIRRVGHIRAFAAMAAVGSAAVLCHGLVVHPVVWFALRAVTGVAVLGVYMVVESWLNEQAPQVIRGQVFAAYMMVSLICLALGQYLILIGDIGALTLFAVAAMLFTLGLVPIAATRVHAPQPQLHPPSLSFGRLLQLSPLATLGAFMAGIVNSAFWGLGAIFTHRVGLSEAGTALFMSATIFGGALLQWPIGRWSDHHGRRGVLTLVSFAAMAMALLVLLVMYRSLAALIACAFLYGGLMFSIYSLSVAYMNDRLHTPGEVLEATRGLLLVYGIGAITGPVLGGPLMDYFGPGTVPAYSAAVLGLLGLTGLARMAWRPPVPVEEQGEFVPIIRTTPVALEMLPQAEAQMNMDLPPAEDP